MSRLCHWKPMANPISRCFHSLFFFSSIQPSTKGASSSTPDRIVASTETDDPPLATSSFPHLHPRRPWRRSPCHHDGRPQTSPTAFTSFLRLSSTLLLLILCFLQSRQVTPWRVLVMARSDDDKSSMVTWLEGVFCKSGDAKVFYFDFTPVSNSLDGTCPASSSDGCPPTAMTSVNEFIVGSASCTGTGGEEDVKIFNIFAPPQSLVSLLSGFLLHLFFQVVLLGIIDRYCITNFTILADFRNEILRLPNGCASPPTRPKPAPSTHPATASLLLHEGHWPYAYSRIDP
uniref:Uncharacterized protein n=1 Tax=Lactuca sativa TaxID=4236 RepID=A0A9R1WIT8_LACSA|nr:hypothetical protein LSAT_V11C100009820 [Lactuca sativa]